MMFRCHSRAISRRCARFGLNGTTVASSPSGLFSMIWYSWPEHSRHIGSARQASISSGVFGMKSSGVSLLLISDRQCRALHAPQQQADTVLRAQLVLVPVRILVAAFLGLLPESLRRHPDLAPLI